MSKEKFKSLRELFEFEIRDLYSAETQLEKALPKMAESASNKELQSSFKKHLKETIEQRERLEKIGDLCDFAVKGHTCDAMKGLIKEGEEVIESKADGPIKDAALISASQRVEHYEIAAYGTAKNFAEHLGFDEVARLLQTTLDQEKETNMKLNKLAVEKINAEAMKVSS